MGRINSIETMGLVDGPGIRVVVFFQGCKNRCIFCHNPETLSMGNGIEITSKELIEKILRYKTYFRNNGGVTFSGGEPLMQPDFLLECLKECKKNNINTCLDTSGVGFGNYDEILSYVDLVIYDIKALDRDKYMDITKNKIDETLNFLKICQKYNKKMWIRQVILPGINDTDDYILSLANYIKKINNVLKIELLPYHDMGKEKYKKLNLNYELEEMDSMNSDKCQKLYNNLLKYMKL